MPTAGGTGKTIVLSILRSAYFSWEDKNQDLHSLQKKIHITIRYPRHNWIRGSMGFHVLPSTFCFYVLLLNCVTVSYIYMRNFSHHCPISLLDSLFPRSPSHFHIFHCVWVGGRLFTRARATCQWLSLKKRAPSSHKLAAQSPQRGLSLMSTVPTHDRSSKTHSCAWIFLCLQYVCTNILSY